MYGSKNRTPEKTWERVVRCMGEVPLQANGQRFLTYLMERRASGKVKSSTLAIDAFEFRRLGRWLGDRPVGQIQREDIVAFFSTLNQLKENSRYKTFVVTRDFFRWIHDLDHKETPPEFRRFSIPRPSKKRLRPEDLITPEELQKMLRFCRNSQERCLITMLYEAGPRSSEVLTFNIGSLDKQPWGYIARMPDDGTSLKTGPRPLTLIESKDYLQAWLQEHALRDRPEAPLFYGLSRRYPYRRMGYTTLHALVARLRKDSGIQKRIYPHLYRHTAATNLARHGLAGQYLSLAFGWSDDSDMPATYVHLSQDDVQERLLAIHGLGTPKASLVGGLQKLTCRACKRVNAAQTLFCAACETPLTPVAQKSVEAKEEGQVRERLARMLHDLVRKNPASTPSD